MKGVNFLGDRKLVVREFPKPTPGPGDVLVKMKASAICGTDMHHYRKSWDELVAYRKGLNGSTDTITGHEPSGVVEEVGPDVVNVKIGDRVSVYQHFGCGTCRHCLVGDVMYCPERRGMGSAKDGSAADYLMCPERNCMPIPDWLSFEKAAVLSCAGGTGYQSVKRLNIQPGETFAVFGLGPVGLSALMFGIAAGAKIFGVDIIPERLELAKKLGAEETFNASTSNPVTELMSLTNGIGVDAAADYSGNKNSQRAIMDAARKGGRAVIVGVGGEFTVSTGTMIDKQFTLMGSWVYNKDQFSEIIRYVGEHQVPIEDMITHRFTIDEAQEALDLFDAGKAAKIVFTWET